MKGVAFDSKLQLEYKYKSGRKSDVSVCSSIHNVRISSIGAKHISVEHMGAGGMCSPGIFLALLDHLCSP